MRQDQGCARLSGTVLAAWVSPTDDEGPDGSRRHQGRPSAGPRRRRCASRMRTAPRRESQRRRVQWGERCEATRSSTWGLPVSVPKWQRIRLLTRVVAAKASPTALKHAGDLASAGHGRLAHCGWTRRVSERNDSRHTKGDRHGLSRAASGSCTDRRHGLPLLSGGPPALARSIGGQVSDPHRTTAGPRANVRPLTPPGSGPRRSHTGLSDRL